MRSTQPARALSSTKLELWNNCCRWRSPQWILSAWAFAGLEHSLSVRGGGTFTWSASLAVAEPKSVTKAMWACSSLGSMYQEGELHLLNMCPTGIIKNSINTWAYTILFAGWYRMQWYAAEMSSTCPRMSLDGWAMRKIHIHLRNWVSMVPYQTAGYSSSAPSAPVAGICSLTAPVSVRWTLFLGLGQIRPSSPCHLTTKVIRDINRPKMKAQRKQGSTIW